MTSTCERNLRNRDAAPLAARRNRCGGTGLVAAMIVAASAATALGQEKPAAVEAPSAAAAFGGVGGVQLSRAEAAQAMALVRHVLTLAETDASIKRMPTPEAVAHALAIRFKDAWPLKEPATPVFWKDGQMQVFVSLYLPGGMSVAAEGTGRTLVEALALAAMTLTSGDEYRQSGFSQLAEVRIGLDVTVVLVPYMVNLAEPFLYSLRPGLDGLVYENMTQRSVVLPWEAVRKAWDMKYARPAEDKSAATTSPAPDKSGASAEKVEEFRPARTPEDIKAVLFSDLLSRAKSNLATFRAPTAVVRQFTSQSFVEATKGGADAQVLALYRTGPLVRAESLTDAEVAAAANLAADFLARTPNADKEIRAAYDPLRNTWQDNYQAPRQALAAAALAAWGGPSKQEWMQRAARVVSAEVVKGLRRESVKTSTGQELPCAHVGEAGRSELALTAQVLVGLAAVESAASEASTREAVIQLANAVLVSQQVDGSFKVYFAPGTAAELVAKDIEDLRGETLSLLALTLAYDRTGNQEYLLAARKTAEYLVFQREKKLGRQEPRGLADPYLIEALAALDTHLVNDAFVNYAVSCANAIVERQMTDPSQAHRDELGGFRLRFSYPEAEHSAFCLRGLRAMEHLATKIEKTAPSRFARLGLTATRDRMREASRRAEAFLVGLQYTPANLFYAPTAAIAAGGFRQSAYDSQVYTVAVCNFLLAESR